MSWTTLGGSRIEYKWIRSDGNAGNPIVLLHEGLGSLSMWRNFPTRLNAATDRPVLTYSREGYGRSSALTGPRRVSYMHDEALQTLPALLDQLNIASPILLGHSDGASIALIHAAEGVRPVSGLVLLAPHIFVEDTTIRAIAAAKRAYESGDLRSRLSRYHDNVDSAFRGWNDIWLSPSFRKWNIEELLPRVLCPVLAVQGVHDEYGTLDQIAKIGRAIPCAEILTVKHCGHAVHRQQPRWLLAEVTEFIRNRISATPK